MSNLIAALCRNRFGTGPDYAALNEAPLYFAVKRATTSRAGLGGYKGTLEQSQG